jgi:acetyltransferase-like isoleucine patch superfamily enzyme
MRKIFSKILSFPKFYFYLLLGKLLGISCIIRYLRNPDPSISIHLLRAFGAKIGVRTTIKRTIFLDNVYEDENSKGNFSHLKIGDNCYVGDCVYFDLANEIIIGDNVVISGGVSFITHADCNRSKYLSEKFPRTCKRIIINDGAWIGFRTIILNGSTIGQNSVIAAGSLVKEDVEKYCLYSGVPAKKIKSLLDA